MPQANDQLILTLYTVIGDFSRVRSTLAQQFAPVTKAVEEDRAGGDGEDLLTLRLQDDSLLQIRVNHNPDFISAQIPGMRSFFSGAPCRNAELHRSVLNQISVFNCVASCAFVPDEDQQRTNYIINTVLEAARVLNALLLMPSMELYTGEGKLLLAPDGRSECDSYTPIGNSDFLDSGKQESPADTARRERSLAVLAEKGIPFMEHLYVAVTEEQASIRTPQEIARRLLAMFGVCVYCEVMQSESREETQKYLQKVDELLKGQLQGCLTPAEQALLQEQQPQPQALAAFGWRYECCHVLLWALGYLPELGYPQDICDVPAIARTLWRCGDVDQLLSGAQPRSRDELLDAADLILRYAWACVDARIHQRQPAANLNGEVVYEWHYALNWLVGANGDAGWDDISTDT